MVNFKLDETNVKMKWSACHERGTKKKKVLEPTISQTPGGRSIHLIFGELMVLIWHASCIATRISNVILYLF